MIEVITRASRARGAAADWAAQYGYTWMSRRPFPAGADRKATHDALVALGPNPDPDAVDRIIGNTAWTEVPRCDACENRTSVVVRVGQPPDHESATADVCLDCLRAAIALGEAG